jgi:hypothetical protein
MIRAKLVRASVVDIRNVHSFDLACPSTVAVDANVLYFFCQPVAELKQAGALTRPAAATKEYPKWVGHFFKSNCHLVTSKEVYCEFLRTLEHSLLLLAYLSGPVDQNRSEELFNAKEYRYDETVDLKSIRHRVETYAHPARKLITFLPACPPETEYNLSLSEWKESMSDLPDSSLVALMKRSGVRCILSDDQDLATMDGITLYTANLRAINASR